VDSCFTGRRPRTGGGGGGVTKVRPATHPTRSDKFTASHTRTPQPKFDRPIPGDNPSRHALVDEHNIPKHENEHNEWPTSADNSNL
jgi:hypothetical protein